MSTSNKVSAALRLSIAAALMVGITGLATNASAATFTSVKVGDNITANGTAGTISAGTISATNIVAGTGNNQISLNGKSGKLTVGSSTTGMTLQSTTTTGTDGTSTTTNEIGSVNSYV